MQILNNSQGVIEESYFNLNSALEYGGVYIGSKLVKHNHPKEQPNIEYRPSRGSADIAKQLLGDYLVE